MELYRGTSDRSISITVPSGIDSLIVDGTTNITATWGEDGTYSFPRPFTFDIDTSSFQLTVPYFLTALDTSFVINVAFDFTENSATHSYSDVVVVDVVTPLVSNGELAVVTGISDTAKLKILERQVRYTIQAITGQDFGRFSGSFNASGDGTGRLSLPNRLLSFTDITASNPDIAVYTDDLQIIGDGWYLGAITDEILEIKQAPDEVINGVQPINGVIYVPSNTRRFNKSVTYTVTGIWGYNNVPYDIQEAARLLAADYSCSDTIYRDRYISSVHAADWQLRYDDGAFAGTGNARVDALIEPYKKMGMVII
jgi:hypothetical protein